MRKTLLIGLFLLGACQKAPAPTEPDAYPDLPRAERMTDKGDMLPPAQAREFCAEHKDFDKC